MVNYLFLLAEEVRKYMSRMRFRTFQEMIGRTDKLRFEPNPNNPKASLLNFDPILKYAQDLRPDVSIRGGSVQQDFKINQRLVRQL